jgi:hypothetical protein
MAKMVKVDERVYGPGPRDDIEVLVAVPGDEITEEEAERLGVNKAVASDTRRSGEADADGVRHVGGGWYELPDGERIRGEDAARERLEALRLSQEEATINPDDPASGAEPGTSGADKPAGA